MLRFLGWSRVTETATDWQCGIGGQSNGRNVGPVPDESEYDLQ